MELDLQNENAEIKREILKVLLPAFTEKDVIRMTNLPRSTIGYYRREYKIVSFSAKKKLYEQEAEKDIAEHLEHNREFAIDRANEICADFGIGYD